MDEKKIKLDKASGVEDDFPFLPDELLLYILSKISELKTLCHCSLVSKRFASVIYQVRAVSVTLPSNTAESLNYYTREYCSLRGAMSPFSSDQLPEYLEKSLHKLKPPVFLEKFSELESIYWEYTFPRTDDNSSLLKWKVNYSSGSSIVDNFVAILPASVHKKTDYVPDQDFNNSATSRFPDCFSMSYGCFMEWLCLTCMLLKCHTTLRCVTVTDSRRQGKLVIRDEQLFKIRSCLLNKERGISSTNPHAVLSFYSAPELHLPVSGYVMKGCRMVTKVTRERNASGEYDDDDTITSGGFDEEEKVFDEAIKEFLKSKMRRG